MLFGDYPRLLFLMISSTYQNYRKCNRAKIQSHLEEMPIVMEDDTCVDPNHKKEGKEKKMKDSPPPSIGGGGGRGYERFISYLSFLVKLYTPMKRIGSPPFPIRHFKELKELMILKKKSHNHYKTSMDFCLLSICTLEGSV